MTTVKELGQITEEIVSGWLTKYNKGGLKYFCKNCGWPIRQTTCYVSLHLRFFEPCHAGPGKVIKINYPYCPNCDGEIDYATACFHIGLALLKKEKKTPKLKQPDQTIDN